MRIKTGAKMAFHNAPQRSPSVLAISKVSPLVGVQIHLGQTAAEAEAAALQTWVIPPAESKKSASVKTKTLYTCMETETLPLLVYSNLLTTHGFPHAFIHHADSFFDQSACQSVGWHIPK